MILIALFCGLRKSEILGLNWEDINLETGAMRICRSRHAKKGGGVYEDTPKTDRSNRDIALPREILSFLRELKVQQLEEKLIYGNRYTDSPALIKNRFGEPLHPHSPYKWLKQFTESAGIRDIGLHGLRHTHASMLASMGTDKVQVSKRLGHSQISTTLNIYTHLFENKDQEIADGLSENYLRAK